MKTIQIEFNRKSTSEVNLNSIINEINDRFEIIDDSNDKYPNLRFVTINATDINIDLNGLDVCLRSIGKPHIFTSIYKYFVHAVEVTL